LEQSLDTFADENDLSDEFKELLATFKKKLNEKAETSLEIFHEEYCNQMAEFVNDDLKQLGQQTYEPKLRFDYFPDGKNSKVGDRAKPSCNEAIDDGVIQQYQTNLMAANWVLTFVSELANNKVMLEYSALEINVVRNGVLYFDTAKGNSFFVENKKAQAKQEESK
jgi:hypothetical protein